MKLITRVTTVIEKYWNKMSMYEYLLVSKPAFDIFPDAYNHLAVFGIKNEIKADAIAGNKIYNIMCFQFCT